jgi:hypothetical protein
MLLEAQQALSPRHGSCFAGTHSGFCRLGSGPPDRLNCGITPANPRTDVSLKRIYAAVLPLLLAGSPLVAQVPAFVGTWQADLKDQKRKDAPRTVIVRVDSSASYGTETVRWRLKPDSIMLALGGEWVTYGLQVKGTRLTLSGGDLQKPVSLTRVGPPSVRPDSVPVPPDPDKVP